MENMELWDKLRQPPTSALKTIQAGRLKGKSDINPQWRMQAMTATFGPCGMGWKYTIDKLWLEPGTGQEVFAFAQVSLYYRTVQEQDWSTPIPGIGGSMLTAKESTGLHNSDEAYKMAVTDALSVAMKALGMAADIYMGLWDGSKYRDDPVPPASPPNPDAISQPQIQKILIMLKEREENKAKYKLWVQDILKLEAPPVSMKDLTKAQGKAIIDALEKIPVKEAANG